MTDADLITIPLNCKPVRIRASLTISHQLLVPERVTQILDLKPTRSHRKGEICPPFRVPKTQGIWVLSSRHLGTETDINEHLRWLLTQFKNKTGVLDQLSDEGYEMRPGAQRKR